MPFIRPGITYTGSGNLLANLTRLVVLVMATIALLAAMIIGILVVIPLMLAGGIASYFYLRRRARQTQQRHDVIEAEYRVIDRP